MRLTVTGRQNELTRLWADALDGVTVRHPNRAITLLVTLEDYKTPMIHFEMDTNVCSCTERVISPFRIGNVKLSYFPGVAAARGWLAAAWGCFMQHEAVELVTVGDIATRVLDPHSGQPRMDHVFSVGFPAELTPDALFAALCKAIPRDDAIALMESSR
jgi:hypothetical protein